MSGVFKSILTQGGIYGLGRILVRAVGFLMIPVYTRHLTPSDYGILELLDLFLTVFGLFVSNGVNSAIFKFYYAYEDGRDKGQVVSTAIWCVLAATLIIVAGVVPNTGRISALLFDTAANGRYVALALVPFVCNLLGDIPMGYLRAKQKAGTYTGVSLVRVVTDLSLVLFFLAGLGWGVRGILVSQGISAFLFASFLLTFTLRETGVAFAPDKAKRILRFGLPLIPSSIGIFIINNGDRFFLKHFGGLADVGVYSLGYKFGYMISFLVLQPFMLIWDAKLYEISRQKDASNTYGRIFTYLVFVLLAVGLGLSLLIKPIVHIVAAQAFWAAAAITPLVAFAYVLQGFYYFFQGGLYLKDRTEFIGITIFGTSVITLALYWFLIGPYKSMGAAVATLLSFLIMSAFMFIVSQRVYPILYEYRRLAILAAAASLVGAGRWVWNFQTGWLDTAYCVLLGAAFPLAVHFLGFFRPEEKRAMGALLLKLQGRKA